VADRPPADHGLHDRLVIAAYAAGDAERDEERRARLLVESCDECRLLAADLRTIASASRALGAWRPARSRDFRLTPEAAAAARPRGLRSGLAAVMRLRDTTLRQAGLGLTALGLVGILVTGASLGGGGLGAAGGARSETTSDAARFGAQAAPTDTKAGGSPGSVLAPIGTRVDDTREASPNAAAPTPSASGRDATLATIVGVVSGLLLVVGVLLLLVPVVRRRPDGT
jgi:hypothetical protein